MNGTRRLSSARSLKMLGVVSLCCGFLLGCSDKKDAPPEAATAPDTAQATPAQPAPSPAPTDSAEKSVAVPRVLDLRLGDAADSLRNAGLQFEANRKEVAGVPEGQVVDQDPKADVLVPGGTVVRLVVAAEVPPFKAGRLNGSSTPLNDDGRGNMVYLDRHAPDCGANAINEFRLTRAGTSNRYQYLYTCTSGGSLGPPAGRSTKLDLDGSGNAVYLDRQNVDCGANAVLTKFHLARGSGTVRYDYSCAPSKVPLKCRDTATAFNDEGGGSAVYLDRHDVRCKADEAISQFRLLRSGRATFHYTYRCCSVQ
ncbi:MAG: PASTA domain-containing protein [Burkholderiaceae bacterium]|nr:PASTA domain-containing protein [Burkholderiaceae bacterium]